MLTWYMIIFAFVTLLGASTLYYQVFRMIQLDAACRLCFLAAGTICLAVSCIFNGF